ncbi:hypothetical protein C0J52_05276 [Blattella germanica]|nr:hypothetical protein C0J52_05276 [Blattella germanica]
MFYITLKYDLLCLIGVGIFIVLNIYYNIAFVFWKKYDCLHKNVIMLHQELIPV